MNHFTALAFLTLSLIAFKGSAQNRLSPADSVFVYNPKLSAKIRQKMLDSAFANDSTAPNFVVFRATNQLTGRTKEICTEAPFVEGGVDRNKGKLRHQNYKSQHFYFNTKAALENIGFDEYRSDELIEYGRKKEVRLLVSRVLKNKKVLYFLFQGTRKEQFMLAHILFNHGILSTTGDIAGNEMTLTKVD